jgi:hypothetical protein
MTRLSRGLRCGFVALPLLAALTLLAALAMTACGSDGGTGGIATAGGAASQPDPSSSAPKLSDSERAVKFAKCMREHGVDMPDPDPGTGAQGFAVKGADAAKMEAAMAACKQYAPFGGKAPKLDQAEIERMRQHARCMRANGVPDFPDPGADGLIKIGPESGIKPDDPKLKAAMEKCKEYLPPMRAETRGGAR